MKYFAIAGLLIFLFSAFAAKHHAGFIAPAKDSLPGKNKKERLIEQFPPGTVTDSARTAFIKKFNTGKIIYKQTCAKCHDSLKNGKLYFPDFSPRQLLDYELRFKYPQHQESMKATDISMEEFYSVVLFLQYKKHNTLAKK